jgi:hypothetical protein
MGAAEVGQRRAAGMVAVFQQVAGGIAAAGAEIDREHRFDSRDAAPIDEFVGAELVSLGREPGQFQPARPLLDRADTVFPVVAADEVAARVADDGWSQFAHQFQDVLAKAVGVGGGMAGLENAAVDAAAEMLDESAEQARVGAGDHRVGAELHGDLTHGVVVRHDARFGTPEWVE